MLVNYEACEETAKDIIWEFEELLCNSNIKIKDEKKDENDFEKEHPYINKKDYDTLKRNITKDLMGFSEFVEYKIQSAA